MKQSPRVDGLTRPGRGMEVPQVGERRSRLRQQESLGHQQAVSRLTGALYGQGCRAGKVKVPRTASIAQAVGNACRGRHWAGVVTQDCQEMILAVKGRWRSGAFKCSANRLVQQLITRVLPTIKKRAGKVRLAPVRKREAHMLLCLAPILPRRPLP